jgi:glycosyltransferase involved in cell wall biosynthesis
MNLLHVTPYYAPAWAYGGVVRAATGLTRALTMAGHKVIVLTTDTLDRSRRISTCQETIDGVSVIRVRNQSNGLRGKFNISTPIGYGRVAHQLVQEYAIDLIHCHEFRTTENLYITRVAHKLNRPLVVSVHGTLSYRVGRRRIKQVWDKLFGKCLFPCFDQVIALTNTEAEEARTLWTSCNLPLRADQVSIVPNGIFPEEFSQLPPADQFRSQWGLGQGPVVVFLGRLAERKGLQLLLPAFANASRHVPDAHLLIVGPDENMRPVLDDQIDKFHLAGRVIFTGLLIGNEKLAALAASDLFVLPAVGEGFSMAVLEAMACGLPVLLSTECHFPEVAKAGAGLVFSREQDALSEVLQMLLLDKEKRIHMGKRAHELVHTRYLWSQLVTQVELAYRTAMGSHHELQRG